MPIEWAGPPGLPVGFAHAELDAGEWIADAAAGDIRIALQLRRYTDQYCRCGFCQPCSAIFSSNVKIAKGFTLVSVALFLVLAGRMVLDTR